MSLTIHQPLERILPAEALAHMNLWAARMQQLVAAGRGWTKLAEQLAPEWGASYGTITRYYYAFQKHGPAGLVDARKYGKYLTSGTHSNLPAAFIEEWRSMIEQAKRRNTGKQCYRILLQKLQAWRRGDQSCRIAGYDSPPPNQPGKSYPAGWSYDNLMRKLEDADTVRAQIGGRAASKYMPMVYTTRVGLQPGQVLMIDDQWHDVDVAWNDGQIGRPLSFDIIDVASGFDIIYGIQPRIKTESGKWMGLKQQDAFWLLLSHLCRNGYRADLGTQVVIEAGTATYDQAIAEGLKLASGGKIITAKGNTHNAGLKGLIFDGQRKGNPNFKAFREGSFSLLRTFSAHLIGGTGKDIAHAPEEHENIVRYTRKLLKLVPQHQWHLLQLPLLTEEQFQTLLSYIKKAINQRTWHNLEGWERAGHMVTEYRLPGSDPDEDSSWLPIHQLQNELQKLPPEKAEILTLTLTSSGLTRTRRMSPAEVWERHADKLTPLSAWDYHIIIPSHMGHTRRVEDNMEFRVYGLGPDVMRYDARCLDPRGHHIYLKRRQEYLIYLNPIDPDTALVCDLNGAPIGVCNRIIPFSRVDTESYLRRQAEVTAMKQDMTIDVTRRAEPIAKERQAMVERNERVVKGLPVTAEEHEAHDLHTRSSAMVEEFLDNDQPVVSTIDPTPSPGTTPDDQPDASLYFDN